MNSKKRELKTYLKNRGPGFDKPIFSREDISETITNKKNIVKLGSFSNDSPVVEDGKLIQFADPINHKKIIKLLKKLTNGKFSPAYFDSNNSIKVYYDVVKDGIELNTRQFGYYVSSFIRHKESVFAGGGIKKESGFPDIELNLKILLKYVGPATFKDIFINGSEMYDIFIKSLYKAEQLQIPYEVFNCGTHMYAFINHFKTHILVDNRSGANQFSIDDLPLFPVQINVILLRELILGHLTGYKIGQLTPTQIKTVCSIMDAINNKRGELIPGDTSEIVKIRESNSMGKLAAQLAGDGGCSTTIGEFIETMRDINLSVEELEQLITDGTQLDPQAGVAGTTMPGQQPQGERMLSVGEVRDDTQKSKYYNFIKNILGINTNTNQYRDMFKLLDDTTGKAGKIIDNIVSTTSINEGFELDLYKLDDYLHSSIEFQNLFDPPKETKIKATPNLKEIETSPEEIKEKSVPSDIELSVVAKALREGNTDNTTQMIFRIKDKSQSVFNDSAIAGNIQTSALTGISSTNASPQIGSLNTYATLPGASFWISPQSAGELIKVNDYAHNINQILNGQMMFKTLSSLNPSDRITAFEKIYTLHKEDIGNFRTRLLNYDSNLKPLFNILKDYFEPKSRPWKGVVAILEEACKEKKEISTEYIRSNALFKDIVTIDELTGLQTDWAKDKDLGLYKRIVGPLSGLT